LGRDLCTGEPKAYKRYKKSEHKTDISNELKTLNTLVRDDTADPRAELIVQYDAIFETDTEIIILMEFINDGEPRTCTCVSNITPNLKLHHTPQRTHAKHTSPTELLACVIV
jgi:hypothetical protein